MRTRTYRCTREIMKGLGLQAEVTISLNDFITIREAEAELKETLAEEWNCSLDEIRLKLLSKSGKKRTVAEIIEAWANGNFED